MSTSISPSVRARLPARWADEMARRTSTTPGGPDDEHGHAGDGTGGGGVAGEGPGGFDARLDDFLQRFHAELVAARAAKDSAAAGSDEFCLQMARVQEMYAAEGRDFAAALERRNPAFATAAVAVAGGRHTADGRCYGENTLELARGIERLELAVHEEELKRVELRKIPAAAAAAPADRSGPCRARQQALRDPAAAPNHQSARLQHSHDDARRQKEAESCGPDSPRSRLQPSHPVQPQLSCKATANQGRSTVPRGSVVHTLSNLHSDETLCLMQSDIHALKLELMRLQRSKAAGGAGAGTGSRAPPPSDVDKTFTLSTVSPARSAEGPAQCLGQASAGPPGYLSHLEQMKSRLEALERKPLPKPSETARKRSQAHIARTRTMNDLYARSRNGSQDENSSPNIMRAPLTPPIERKRSISRRTDGSLKYEHGNANVIMTVGDDDVFYSPAGSSSSSSTPPRGQRDEHIDELSLEGLRNDDGSSARRTLFSIDAPEELLKRPQSHAAARDIQRYSLTVAQRLGPVAWRDHLKPSEIPAPRVRGPLLNGDDFEPDERYKRNPQHRVPVARSEAVSETGQLLETEPVKSNAILPVKQTGQRQQQTLAPAVSAPETVKSAGSGQVIEEMEGSIMMRKGNIWKRWRLRYASIVSHQFFGRVLCLFSYDATHQVISSRSEIIVLHDALCRAVRSTVEISGEPQYVFALRTGKEYYFATSSDTVRKQWVREIRRAARSENPRVSAEHVIAPPLQLCKDAVKTRKTLRQGDSAYVPVGRSVTYTGHPHQEMSRSGGLSLMRPRRGPFRRAEHA